MTSDTILLYAQDSRFVDYVALVLRDGGLVYSYNLGGGDLLIAPTGRYDDDITHTVSINVFLLVSMYSYSY